MHLDRLATFASTRRAVVLVGLWAFAEALFLPVVPDIALGLVALAAPRRAPRLFALAILAALAGSAVLYALTLWAPGTVGAVLVHLPGIDPAMLAGASSTVAGGSPASIALLRSGTPLKVFTHAWALGPATPLALAAGVALNRLTRIGPLLALEAAAGWIAPGFLRRHERVVLAGYAAFWLVVYAFSWGLV